MIDKLFNEYQAKINARLDILLSESDKQYDEVVRAARYSLISSGKRIRPILMLEFYKLCGGDDDCAYNFACALEMIHTYSLIHDDLPCMDNDDFRRGKPSCHKQFGETMALLAGDALLTEAFNAASRTIGIPAGRIVEALTVLSANAGINGMIGGQVIDLINTEQISADDTVQMYLLKTGALINSATVCGAILAGADEQQRKNAAEYAEKLGLAFQIIDDILDAEGDESVLGKPVGSDSKNDKKTLVARFGIEKCREFAHTLTKEALAALDKFEGNKENLVAITEFLLSRKY
ncbi:MAG: polyprenyl synthetase family protein [Clostridia bacterium]|nr:polyprenyl synthetase family protein [Clostridia bacterium]